MRKYQEIWDRLKTLPPLSASLNGISITANPVVHSRIIKAVKKEKNKDLLYKLTIEPRNATLNIAIKGSIITFKLNLSVLEGDF